MAFPGFGRVRFAIVVTAGNQIEELACQVRDSIVLTFVQSSTRNKLIGRARRPSLAEVASPNFACAYGIWKVKATAQISASSVSIGERIAIHEWALAQAD